MSAAPPADDPLRELLTMARADDRLRDVLVRVGRLFVGLEPSPVAELAPPPAAVVATPVPVPTPSPPVPFVPLPAPDLRPRVVAEVPAYDTQTVAAFTAGEYAARAEVSAEDLPKLAKRFEVKADGCLWNLARRELLARTDVEARAEIARGDREIIDAGKQYECYLWMCRPNSPRVDPEAMRALAECYRNVGEVARLVARGYARTGGAGPVGHLELLAEAQSALRIGLDETAALADADQQAVFRWIRDQASRREVYIGRHMRMDDPADPADWASVRQRATAEARLLDAAEQSVKGRTAAVNRVKYHANKLSTTVAGSSDEAQEGRRLVDAVAKLVAEGMPPSNADVRDLLVPVLDRLPAQAADDPGYALVAREIERFQDQQEADEAATVAAQPDRETADVAAVRAALAGRSIVLIGGDERADAAAALKAAFGLCDVDWQASRPHESHYTFRAAIARPEVAAVVLMIRWASHSYAEVRGFCEEMNKPLVRLTAGYGVNRMAAALREQAGKRLGIG